MAPTSATTAAAPSGFVAGGGFNARLHSAEAPPPVPRLPGGHRYLGSDLPFIPVARQSLEGKVHMLAGMVFGWVDVTCKELEFESAKSRSQQIADGYTSSELRRRMHERHCN